MEKEHNQWCEITGIKVGDKVCVVAPHHYWHIRDDYVGKVLTVLDTHHRPHPSEIPPLCVLVDGNYPCIPFWCLAKVEDEND